MITNRPGFSTTELSSDAPAVVWEETPCPLCGRDAGAPVLEAADPLPPHKTGLVFAVVRCTHCSLVYTNPRGRTR